MLRANGGMMALALPAGEHRVELRYAAPAVWIGLALAALGLVGLAMICWRGGPPAWRRAEREAVTSPGVAAGLAEADAAESPAAAAERPWEVALEAWLQRSWPWVLAGLLVLGAALRLYHLGTQELRGDEAFSVLMAQGSPGTIIHNLLANGDPHSPLHYLLVHATLSVAGWGELALRLPSALLGLLAIPVFCWVGRQAGGRPWALLLALLAAGAQPLVWIGQDLRNQYVLAVLASAAATGLLLWQASGPPRRWRAAGWLAYALLLALTVYGFYYAGLALLGHGAYLLLHGERRRLWLPWCLAVALAVALFLPWALVAAPAVLASNQLKSPTAPALAPFVLESATYLTAGDGWARPWGRGIAALGLLLAGLGARRLWRRDRALAGASLLALLATGLALYLVRHLRSVYEPRYLLGSLLFWWVLLLSGLEGLWRSRRPGARWLGALLLAVLLAVNGVGVVRYHLAPAQPRTVGYRAAAAIIAAHAQPGDVFVRNAPDPCWDYYLRDLPMTRAMVPGEPLPEDDAIARALITLGQEHDRLWFVPGMNPEWDPEQRARHWLEYNMLRERLEPAGFFTVLAYRPPRSALRAMLADGSELESAITLEGYSLLLSGQPVDPAQPLALHEGDTLEVTLAWRPAQRLERDYTVFVHLLGQDGVLRTQHDGPPLLGTRPTTYWEAGELVLDRHTLQLPALEGEGATLHLGMYDSVTVERVPWRGGGDARIIPLRLAP
ncbi:MAG: hypothetical protein GXY79_00935 [Chloroflexi bacterium]|nr:hypothetical protein [Chloroflexota bacterium]